VGGGGGWLGVTCVTRTLDGVYMYARTYEDAYDHHVLPAPLHWEVGQGVDRSGEDKSALLSDFKQWVFRRRGSPAGGAGG
jgi:hypothetical protein